MICKIFHRTVFFLAALACLQLTSCGGGGGGDDDDRYTTTPAGSLSVSEFNSFRASHSNYFEDSFDDDDWMTGYFSDVPLEGVDEDYIAKVMTVEDFTAMANQLNHSLGNYASYFSVICLVIAAALLYLLTKQIIEKNSVSISMTKVLGYYNKEINSVYIRTTTVFVIVMFPFPVNYIVISSAELCKNIHEKHCSVSRAVHSSYSSTMPFHNR